MQYKKRLDALSRRQEDIDRERDLYIAVFAIFLGIPGVVEMFDDSTLPIDKSYFGFLILFLFIVLTVMYFLRRRNSNR
ncbi:hypothetical protein GP475_00295 [Corynebacterium poyangense]|uniref:Uncharacterized protein n=1 Tax=Corynebacterium poyangense TaxID=2684405 RepID=A0A7H0SL14_9CORY|nr:hypothetical protein [Corynebacterium poyangense]QNQ89239.1 hypothetical protein GP475_00295 [Corynebacterium poyangense]